MSNATKQKGAALRVCGSCEWVFERRPAQASGEPGTGCPKCGFASYGAHWALGHACYRVKRTQERWLARKVSDYTAKLRQEIGAANAERDPADLFHKP